MEDNARRLLNKLQIDFPLESRPFLTIAKELDMTEDEVILLINQLKNKGYIRRLGGVFDSKRLGYSSTLCAMEVPEDRIEEVACMINSYQGVTHNYLRSHGYNMWFTLTALDINSIRDIVDEIKYKTKINHVMVLSAVNTFKIRVNFNIKGE
ncbi:siroheme decarboxylase subunit alpha [Cellulosilyticum sp. I15G10I2]|uniref:siroheme decarboxylase subunit alpha n=1 Tax=Cellulosilyticum sp. I15G10I2 TaxID=1892843 RepID=UPI00085BF337|nr:Lrp/AsnC family transcriptional regulator [Cellulosilyticum sp. I15G10I2]